ncbi:MAG TPA: hypothetical protein DF699_02335, partial [Phycisphaerales bacterium]|nr:hypothetical protein [Phycisphaerales bacterium]
QPANGDTQLSMNSCKDRGFARVKLTEAAHPDHIGQEVTLRHGSVVIAAITSCTNTSNPDVMIAAGLVAKKAKELGLSRKPWV